MKMRLTINVSRLFQLFVAATLLSLLLTVAVVANASASSIAQESSQSSLADECEGSATFSGTITDPEGNPLPDVDIILLYPDGPHEFLPCKETRSNSEGHFTISNVPAGEWNIGVYGNEQDGFKGLTAPPNIPITLVEGESIQLEPIQFTDLLKRVVGTVVDQNGVGASGIQVHAWHSTGNLSLDTTTDSEGRFTFIVSSGTWKARLAYIEPGSNFFDHEDKYVAVTFADDATGEEEEIQFTVERLASSISGRVLHLDGTPISEEMFTWGHIHVEVHGNDGLYYASVPLDGDGYFSLTLPAGIYEISAVNENTSDNGWFAPIPSLEIEIAVDEAVDVGNIYMTNAQVVGNLVGIDGVTPIEVSYDGVRVAHDYNNDGLKTCPPSSNNRNNTLYGLFGLGGLPANDYCLTIYFHTGEATDSPTVDLAFSITDPLEVIDLGTIATAAPTKHIVGKVLQPDGTPIMEMAVYAHRTDGGGASTTTDENGNFTFSLSAGTWEIHIDLYEYFGFPFAGAVGSRQIWFSNEADKTVVFAENNNEETQNIEFVASKATTKITGSLLKSDGMPAIGASFHVKAFSAQLENAHVATSADPETATFELDVVGGQWQIGYYLDEGQSEHDYFDLYVNYADPITITVIEGESSHLDLPLVNYDTTISGKILMPNGSLYIDSDTIVGYVSVKQPAGVADPMKTDDETDRKFEIIDGEFEFNALSGVEYELAIHESCHDPSLVACASWSRQTITATSGSTDEVIVQFVQTDAIISGTVFENDTTQTLRYGQVSARSNKGRETYVEIDADGKFNLPVQSSETWYLSVFHLEDLKSSPEILINIPEAGTYALDLTVFSQDYIPTPVAPDNTDAASTDEIEYDEFVFVPLIHQ